MKLIARHALVALSMLLVACPPGWCCWADILPRPTADDTQPAPAKCCCCKPHAAPTQSPAEPSEPEDSPQCQCEKALLPSQGPEKLQAPAIALLSPLVDASASPAGHNPELAADPVAELPLHLLHCVWRC